jgi:hypothetical protein
MQYYYFVVVEESQQEQELSKDRRIYKKREKLYLERLGYDHHLYRERLGCDHNFVLLTGHWL